MYYNEKTVTYLDGKWLKANEAFTGLYGQTLHYGNGVFEGIRSYQTETGSQLFKANEHFERLLHSAELMHIEVNYSVDELVAIANELLERNQLGDAYVRPLFYLGENMKLEATNDVHLFMCAWEWGKYLGDQSLRVKLSSFCRPHPNSCQIEAKTVGHYTNSILASEDAKRTGYDEALLLDVEGNIAEAPGANFFMEKDGVLVTPSLGHILPGITRATIIELARFCGYEVEERQIKPHELQKAQSAFFVGTAAEVVPIASINNVLFPLPWSESLGVVLAKMYQRTVRNEAYQHFELV